jgi:MinD superfamily P-loop ATPase
VALRDGPPTVVDLGTVAGAPARALLDQADASVIVVRPCYLALRRAVRLEATRRAAGVVLVEEPGRALGTREVADVLGRPVIARIPVRDTIARAVDAGVLPTRIPEPLERGARDALVQVGLHATEARA